MGKSAKIRKRQESRSGDGITAGTVRGGASRASPSARAAQAQNSGVQLSTTASSSSESEALEEIVAEIVVWTDDMEPSATAGSGEGGDEPYVAGPSPLDGEGRDEPSVVGPAPFDAEGGDDLPVEAPEYVISSSRPFEDTVLCDATLYRPPSTCTIDSPVEKHPSNSHCTGLRLSNHRKQTKKTPSLSGAERMAIRLSLPCPITLTCPLCRQLRLAGPPRLSTRKSLLGHPHASLPTNSRLSHPPSLLHLC